MCYWQFIVPAVNNKVRYDVNASYNIRLNQY